MNIIIPTFDDTMRYGRCYNRSDASVYSQSLATACAPSIGTAASGARRGLGMRCGMMAGSATPPTPSYDVQDYVGWGTSDLVAMWDGIRNVGATAAHSTSTSAWQNIVDNTSASVNGTASWGDKYAYLNGSTYWNCGSSYNSKIMDGTCTIEFVVSSSASSGNNAGIISINDYTNNPRKLWIFSQIPTTDGRISCFYKSQSSAWPSSTLSLKNGTFSEWGSGLPHNYGMIVYSNSSVHGFTDGTIDKRGSGFTSNYTTTSTYGSLVIGHIYSFGRMAGNVYCVRIYDRALTAQEVAANYAVDAARFGIVPLP